MLKLILVFLFPSFSLAYPELLTKRCNSCHTEASGYGILNFSGKAYTTTQSHQKQNNYFEVDTPSWLLLSVKADVTQRFTKTPYENTGSFKATRIEGQLGLVQEIDTYLSVNAQGSLNRVEPETKSDSITDYVYSPYRFIEFNYADPIGETYSVKHGYYQNEAQKYLYAFTQSFKQTEILYSEEYHQFSLGYQSKTKNFNTALNREHGFVTYKYFEENKVSLILSHEQGDRDQISSLIWVAPKTKKLSFITALSRTVDQSIKGFSGRLTPVYQMEEFIKVYGFAEYRNPDIQTAKPRTIIYGLGADYLWFYQGLLSVIYSKTDDSMILNNPSEKLELNFHLYM